MEKGFYYLAVPYQGTDEEKEYRTQLSLKAATAFLRDGHYLFAPLLYINKIGDNLQLTSLEHRRSTLMPYLLEFLKVSKGLILVTAEGWDKSWGIHQELVYCLKHEIPVFKLTAEHLDMSLSGLLSKPLSRSQLEDLLKQISVK